MVPVYAIAPIDHSHGAQEYKARDKINRGQESEEELREAVDQPYDD
jgi:hypothetical protein